MTGKDLEQWRKSLGISRREAGVLLACGEDYIYAMERQGKTIGELRARVCWLLGFQKVREGYMNHIGYAPTRTRFTTERQPVRQKKEPA